MILVDSSVWVDYFRRTNAALANLLASTLVGGRASIWSRDRRLAAAAAERGVACSAPASAQ